MIQSKIHPEITLVNGEIFANKLMVNIMKSIPDYLEKLVLLENDKQKKSVKFYC